MDNSFEKLINRVLDNRYKIENVVGIGGMAYVLKATDLKNENRPVAIKILNEEFNRDENAVKRFINESEAIAMVDSPNIVKIYDVAMSESLKYIVMEFIDGITLKDYIDKVGSLGWKEAVHYVRQILNALSHAHEKGVVHRDIKPQNVMLLRDGKVKVTDFGIAKTPTSEALTMTDKAIGTVNYISPEQASGGSVDEKSDLYSVGVMLYEMLTGTLPFKAESPVAVAMMQVNEKPVQPREINPQIPIGLEQIVLKSMSKKPDERFNCAASMERALEYFVKNPTIVFSGISAEEAAAHSNADLKKKRDDKSKHRSMFPIILGVALSFFVVCICSVIYLIIAFGDNPGKILQGNESKYEDVVVENFVGEIYTEDFKASLEEKGYSVTVLDRRDAGKADGEIVDQDPADGVVRKKAVDEPLEITLYVNVVKSVEANVMPSCIGYDILKVRNDLRIRFDAAIPSEKIVVIEEYNEEFPKNAVFDCDPMEGTVIDPENFPTFTFYVSKGPLPVEVIMPDVVGLHRSEAEKKLEEENILFTTKRENSDEPINTVIRTSIAAGDPFMNDTEVILYISGSVSTDTRLRLPQCAGLTKERAKQTIISRFDLPEENIMFEEEYSKTVARGRVIKTTPEGGSVFIVNDENKAETKVVIHVSKGPEPFEVVMPDIIGLHRSEAAEKLESEKILYKEEREYSNEPENTVIRASKNANDVFMSDTEVVIYISKKAPGKPMPDCTGETEENALAEIAHTFGISERDITVSEEYSETVKQGRVVRTSPSAGEPVPDDKTGNITVYISKGPVLAEYAMPDVIGYSLSEAISILRDAGLDNSISRKYEESSEEKNTVLRCNFNVGETLTKDDEIILYVSDASLTEDVKEESDNTESAEDSSESVTEDENLDDILDMSGR